ncbi:Hypothetical protein A7982_11792 [Minicystis rosea]|nr:Hypothetical protein A7982_11792 [Minicystis rosea]
MRTAAASCAVLWVLAPSIAIAAPPILPLPSQSSDLAPRVRVHLGGLLDPTVSFVLRGGGGRDDALASPLLRAYRAAPEIVFGLRPAPHVEIFAGVGAGPAHLVLEPGAPGGPREGMALAISASIGARFPWQGVPFSAIARAESVHGLGAAVMIRFALDLAAAK